MPELILIFYLKKALPPVSHNVQSYANLFQNTIAYMEAAVVAYLGIAPACLVATNAYLWNNENSA